MCCGFAKEQAEAAELEPMRILLLSIEQREPAFSGG